jgi:hypothetical protein
LCRQLFAVLGAVLGARVPLTAYGLQSMLETVYRDKNPRGRRSPRRAKL